MTIWAEGTGRKLPAAGGIARVHVVSVAEFAKPHPRRAICGAGIVQPDGAISTVNGDYPGFYEPATCRACVRATRGAVRGKGAAHVDA